MFVIPKSALNYEKYIRLLEAEDQIDPNVQQADPNAQPMDPNAQQADPNAQPMDPNAQMDPNSQQTDPNAMSMDQAQTPEQAYEAGLADIQNTIAATGRKRYQRYKLNGGKDSWEIFRKNLEDSLKQELEDDCKQMFGYNPGKTTEKDLLVMIKNGIEQLNQAMQMQQAVDPNAQADPNAQQAMQEAYDYISEKTYRDFLDSPYINETIKERIDSAKDSFNNSKLGKAYNSSTGKKVRNVAGAAAGLAAGAALIKSNSNLLLGKKRVYHGTSKDNEESIKEQGLLASHGGKGGAAETVDNKKFKEHSQGKVHFSTRKKTGVGYANLADAYANAPGETKKEKTEYINSLKKKGKLRDLENKPIGDKGALIKADIDYEHYKDAEDDPDDSRGNDGYVRNKDGKLIPKAKAMRMEHDITPEEIVGGHSSLAKKAKHTVKNLPDYIKNNPGRFAAGVIGTAAGTAVAAHSIKKGVKAIKAKNEELDYINQLLEDYTDNDILEYYILGYYNEDIQLDNLLECYLYELGSERDFIGLISEDVF